MAYISILCIEILAAPIEVRGLKFPVILCFCMVHGRFLMPEPQYSIQGHVLTTLTHAAAHKAHILYIPDKTYVSLEYIIYGLKCRRG